MLRTNAVFKYKEADLEQRVCVVEKVIPLSGPEYDAFSRNLLRDHAFIRDHADLMYRDPDGTMHCLLVTGENRQDGILVQSSGYDYARYAALLPNTQDWLRAHVQDLDPSLREESLLSYLFCHPDVTQADTPNMEATVHNQPSHSPAMNDLCDRLNRMVDDITYAVGRTEQGQPVAIDLQDVEQDYGIQVLGSAALCHTVHAMLCERPELAGLDFEWNKNEIIFTPMEPDIESGPMLCM